MMGPLPEFVHPGIELEVGALAGGTEDALAKLGDAVEGREVVALAGALGDRGDDRVHKTVKADKHVFWASAPRFWRSS